MKYDYLVKDPQRVFAVALEDGGPVRVTDVETSETELAPPVRYAEDVNIFEHDGVRVARAGLYDVIETPAGKFEGAFLRREHFLGRHALIFDGVNWRLLSYDMERKKVEVLLEDVMKASLFEHHTCPGVEELRIVALHEGKVKLLSFDRYANLRTINYISGNNFSIKGCIAITCTELGRCKTISCDGETRRFGGTEADIYSATITNEKLYLLLYDRSRFSYAIVKIHRTWNIVESPVFDLPEDFLYDLVDAHDDYVLLHATSVDEAESSFHLFNTLADDDVLVPVKTFGEASVKEEAVMFGKKVYYLYKGEVEVLELSS